MEIPKIDKSNSSVSHFLKAILIVKDSGGRISRADFEEKMTSFLGGSPTRNSWNKSKGPRSFGFLGADIRSGTISELVLTRRGLALSNLISDRGKDSTSVERYYIKKGSRAKAADLFVDSILFDSFGKYNCGLEESKSDAEPIKLLFRLLCRLKKVSIFEFSYSLFELLCKSIGSSDEYDEDLMETIFGEILSKRASKYDYERFFSETNLRNIIYDMKFIGLLSDDNIGLLTKTGDDEILLSDWAKERYGFNESQFCPVYKPLRIIAESKTANLCKSFARNVIAGRAHGGDQFFLWDGVGNSIKDFLLQVSLNKQKPYFLFIQAASERAVLDAISIAIPKGGISHDNLGIIGGIENMSDSKSTFDFKRIFIETDFENKSIELPSDENRVVGGENVILYGVAGSGKSHHISTHYCDNPDLIERIVFYPEYSYSDFVIQIMPFKETAGGTSQISYRYTPGPFLRSLKRALFDPSHMHYLIIEELNRGNAAAIFGDIFQLLDRRSEGRPGESVYKITNNEIASFLYGCNGQDIPIKIPSNLTIIATINTSDQNVFTLDTAFQRRWKMQLVKNQFGNEPKEQELAKKEILDTDVSWRKFAEVINYFIVQFSDDINNSENKQLGTHFVSINELEPEVKPNGQVSENFSSKVIKYLWDDAFKYCREKIFSDDCKDLETTISIFSSSTGDDRFSVFKEDIVQKLKDIESD